MVYVVRKNDKHDGIVVKTTERRFHRDVLPQFCEAEITYQCLGRYIE